MMESNGDFALSIRARKPDPGFFKVSSSISNAFTFSTYAALTSFNPTISCVMRLHSEGAAIAIPSRTRFSAF